MIMQLHHQGKDGSIKFPDSFCSQKDIDPGNYKSMREWLKETQEGHPLPENMMWMVCDQSSEHFIMTVANSTGRRAYIPNKNRFPH